MMENCRSQNIAQPEGHRAMKITTRFGEVEYNPENLLHFPEGLIGFENLHDFIVMPNVKEGPLFWIQSVEDPAIAFILTDPTSFFPDYEVLPDRKERQKLGMAEKDPCFALAVVTVDPDRKVMLNLAGPVLFAPGSNRALQVILEGTRYQPRTLLPTVEDVRRMAAEQE
jgi:flagellar assembly factor FliW